MVARSSARNPKLAALTPLDMADSKLLTKAIQALSDRPLRCMLDMCMNTVSKAVLWARI